MIRIVCESSPITMLPVRALLEHLHFHPRNVREQAGYAFIYPFSGRYRKALNSLSYVERVPEAQFLGISSQWRVRRWLSWLARAIAPLLHKKRIFFYHAERLDEPTKLFFELLQPHVGQGVINLMFGRPSYEGALVADHFHCLLAEERPILALLSKELLSEAEAQQLHEAGIRCVLSANFWQAHQVFRLLLSHNRARSLYISGLAHRFYGQLPAAEWHLERALAASDVEKDPIESIQIRYAIGIMHLRFHEKSVRNYRLVRDHIDEGYGVISSVELPQESRLFVRTMVDMLNVLYAYRHNELEKAVTLCDAIIARLEAMPESSRGNYCLVCAITNKAQLLRSFNRLEEAFELNRRATQLDPQMPTWWIEKAKCLFDLKRLDRVKEILDQALALHFDCADLHALLGRYYRETGQHANSAQSYSRALRYRPSDDDYMREMGAARERDELGRRQKALQSM